MKYFYFSICSTQTINCIHSIYSPSHSCALIFIFYCCSFFSWCCGMSIFQFPLLFFRLFPSDFSLIFPWFYFLFPLFFFHCLTNGHERKIFKISPSFPRWNAKIFLNPRLCVIHNTIFGWYFFWLQLSPFFTIIFCYGSIYRL